ncbi:hypothetical protein [Aquimarina addita]|uniref:hypothetical protein n=1 Tax=Aquimarina addita TaxID=870485 RepID=UPI003CD07BBA
MNNEGVIFKKAVAGDFKNKGIRKEIVKHLIEDCKNKNVKKMLLSAKQTVISF